MRKHQDYRNCVICFIHDVPVVYVFEYDFFQVLKLAGYVEAEQIPIIQRIIEYFNRSIVIRRTMIGRNNKVIKSLCYRSFI